MPGGGPPRDQRARRADDVAPGPADLRARVAGRRRRDAAATSRARAVGPAPAAARRAGALALAARQRRVDRRLAVRHARRAARTRASICRRPRARPCSRRPTGEVVYAGNGIRGYGNLVVLQHAGDLLTVYAHNSVLLVAQGQPRARRRSHRARRAERARDRAALAFRGARRANSPRPDAVPVDAPSSPTRARREHAATAIARLALLRARVRDVPDFPKPGILFRDLTPLMGDGAAMRACVDLLVERVAAHRPERDRRRRVARVHLRRARRGGAGRRVRAGAQAGQAPARDPAPRSYDLEYGTDSLEMHADAVVARRARRDRRRSAGDGRHGGGDRRARARASGGARRRRDVRRRAGAPARAPALDGVPVDALLVY